MQGKLEDADVDGDISAEEEETTPGDVCCVCGSTEEVRRCGKCKLVSYCSKVCQVSHLAHHKKYCGVIADVQKLETDKLYRDFTVSKRRLDGKALKKLVKLVGEKPLLTCLLDDKLCEVLWDTGSMVSLVGRKWLQREHPGKKVYSVSEFLEEKLELQTQQKWSMMG